jgi:uncharacterized protein (TIGR03435 family)
MIPATFVFVFLSGLASAQDGPAPAQTVQSAPQFEYAVATIKPDNSGRGYWKNTADGFVTSGTSALSLIMSAYEIRMPQQIVGLPGWAGDEPLAIEAKMDNETVAALAKLTPEERWKQKDKMLQALLAERFALKVHRTTKELPVYVLTVADARKLKKSTSADDGRENYSNAKLKAHAMSIDNLVGDLPNWVGRMVVNQTGLEGTYDFTLEWAPEGADASDPRPSIFTALEEQMGLKLRPAQRPVDAIVVDAIQRPSDN